MPWFAGPSLLDDQFVFFNLAKQILGRALSLVQPLLLLEDCLELACVLELLIDCSLAMGR